MIQNVAQFQIESDVVEYDINRKLKYKNTSEVWNWLREINAKSRKHAIKGQRVNVWAVPENELSFQTEPHDTPKIGGDF